MGKVLSIGEAAKLAGVSVQTLRHYDRLGLLPPSHVSAAGYRRYSERDCEQLQLIRALREVGFELVTIGQLLASKIELDDAIRMRVEALEADQRALRRRQLLLRAATSGKRKDVLARLKQKHALARLDRFERENFLEKINSLARLHSRPPDAAFLRWMLKRLESSYDERIGRYWELISKIKRIPYDPAYARTFDCLLNALRERAGAQSYAKDVAK